MNRRKRLFPIPVASSLFRRGRVFLIGCLILNGAILIRAQETGVVIQTGSVADDPAAKWVTVYGWTQTGDRLVAAGQWALAMGSYIEAHRQVRQLATGHPDYERELVAYRTGKLEETIATADVRLSEDEHETMMKYLDFIESLELGLAQRFANDYEAALASLDIARSLLDDLIGKKPPEFRKAIDSQYQRLDDNILWLSAQINYTEAGRRRSHPSGNDGRDRGTTRFVKKEDLPGTPGVLFVSGMLFPGGLSVSEPGGLPETGSDPPRARREEAQKQSGTIHPDAPPGAAMRFRMNSRRTLEGDVSTSR